MPTNTQTLYIALGRNGDVLAALPIVQHDPGSVLMVSLEYAPLLDGTSTPYILWDDDWRRVRAAHASVRRGYPRIVVLQQYSTDGWPVAHATDSFVREMYRVAGKLAVFPLPLRFDRRSPEREAALLPSATDKPIILVATHGLSSPFPHGDELLATLERALPSALVIDLDVVRGERLYDLLGLMERALCLITIDSAFLHLAQAVPSLSVIALIADKPTLWHGSPAYAGQRLRIRYGDYPKRKDDLLSTVASLLLAAPDVGVGPETPYRGTPKLGA